MSDTSDQGFLETALFRIMTLLATLSAATEVKYGLEERKAGIDPTDQEEETVVRPYLLSAESEMHRMLVETRASFIFSRAEEEDLIATSVRRFGDLSRLQSLSGILQRVHQRLLSLYPHVSEELVEEARLLLNQNQLILEADAVNFVSDGARFVNRALLFCDWLRREINVTPPRPLSP